MILVTNLLCFWKAFKLDRTFESNKMKLIYNHQSSMKSKQCELMGEQTCKICVDTLFLFKTVVTFKDLKLNL